VERHRRAATITTSNREPIEWLGLMADALLAQSAIDRLQLLRIGRPRARPRRRELSAAPEAHRRRGRLTNLGTAATP